MNSYFNDFTVLNRNISTTNSDSIKTKIKSEIIWKEISVNFFGLTMPLLSFENISTTENNENDPIFVFTVNELTIFCEKNKKLITEEKFQKFTELEEKIEHLDENFTEISFQIISDFIFVFILSEFVVEIFRSKTVKSLK